VNERSIDILASRRLLPRVASVGASARRADDAAEGGCGVLGLASNSPIAGRHVLTSSRQMHNRGNGKGGGIAMVGLDPAQVGVDAGTLRTHYLLQIALLDPSARSDLENQFIHPHFDVASVQELPHLQDHTLVDGLEIRPPDVLRYFVRAKPVVLEEFARRFELGGLEHRALEDEFVYQNTYRLNHACYASLGEKRAFVLSHGRNMSVLKIVGYAEQVVQYYRLEDQTAHVWIAHQRYPTKGRVWHPGGAHPFIGLNEALVHNGDFANYHAVSEYLRQRNIEQLFLTDTEVSVQLFDLWDRVYAYPLEVTLEAMAPTTEHDFMMLPTEKQRLYRAVQGTHIHGSPDGPWFFIVARSKAEVDEFELLGITDTSMLRPQVFALFENEGLQIGLIASERQAIHACLRSISAENSAVRRYPDRSWVARGGSHTDGGAFRFTVSAAGDRGDVGLHCTDKFGSAVSLDPDLKHSPADLDASDANRSFQRDWAEAMARSFDDGGSPSGWNWILPRLAGADWNELAWGLNWLAGFARNGTEEWDFARQVLTLARDRRVELGRKKRGSMLDLLDAALSELFGIDDLQGIRTLDWRSRNSLSAPLTAASTLVIDSSEFPPEGEDAAARNLVKAARLGWKRFVVHSWRGGRFGTVGLGPDTQGLRVDLYGDVGDYAASGLDGAEVHLHGDGQDQVGQIMKAGKLVIHGDVGQTFLYGAKGGEVYVLGSAAGRPLINAVGSPRVVINGTCLDYLAESFMAGDPHRGGGFVIVNGVGYTESGRLEELPSPYPGGNLFSLASGGAIFIRDPRHVVQEDQLNGGSFAVLDEADWLLIEPYLEENARQFGISSAQLLTVDGVMHKPAEVYRKVRVGTAESLLTEAENR